MKFGLHSCPGTMLCSLYVFLCRHGDTCA